MTSIWLAFVPAPATGNGSFARHAKYQWAADVRRRIVTVQIENESLVAGSMKLESIVKLLERRYGISIDEFIARGMLSNLILRNEISKLHCPRGLMVIVVVWFLRWPL